MSEPERAPNGDREEREPFVPASPVKRIIAWVGVVYMVIFVFLNIYPFFHNGVNLQGVGPLLVCPGAAGLAVIAVFQLRRPECSAAGRLGMALLIVACAAVVLVGSINGIPALAAGLGGGA